MNGGFAAVATAFPLAAFPTPMARAFSLRPGLSHGASLVQVLFRVYTPFPPSVPVFTTRLLAEERKLRPLELLSTAPGSGSAWPGRPV